MKNIIAVMAMLVAAGMACTASFAAPVFIQLDLGSGPVQAGWTGVTTAQNYPANAQVDLGGGMSAGTLTTGYYAGDRDRGGAGAGGMSGVGLTEMLQDYMGDSNGNGVDRADAFRIAGLPDGTYDVTVYRYDGNYSGAGATSFFRINDVPTPVDIGPLVSGDVTTIRGTTQIVLSGGAANNVIDIWAGSGAGNGWNFNGIVVEEQASAVPEPATLLLVGTGALGVFGVIRRRRMA